MLTVVQFTHKIVLLKDIRKLFYGSGKIKIHVIHERSFHWLKTHSTKSSK